MGRMARARPAAAAGREPRRLVNAGCESDQSAWQRGQPHTASGGRDESSRADGAGQGADGQAARASVGIQRRDHRHRVCRIFCALRSDDRPVADAVCRLGSRPDDLPSVAAAADHPATGDDPRIDALQAFADAECEGSSAVPSGGGRSCSRHAWQQAYSAGRHCCSCSYSISWTPQARARWLFSGRSALDDEQGNRMGNGSNPNGAGPASMRPA